MPPDGFAALIEQVLKAVESAAPVVPEVNAEAEVIAAEMRANLQRSSGLHEDTQADTVTVEGARNRSRSPKRQKPEVPTPLTPQGDGEAAQEALQKPGPLSTEPRQLLRRSSTSSQPSSQTPAQRAAEILRSKPGRSGPEAASAHGAAPAAAAMDLDADSAVP